MNVTGESVRTLSKSDIPAILELVGLALGPGPAGERSHGWWAWKHIDNPFGESLVLGAFSGDRLVGLRAFMRWDLLQGTDVWRCARAVDTATHPEYRGRGVFRKLTLAGIEQLEAEGIKQIFNTPNGKSGPGYLKMGWRPVDGLHAAGQPTGPRAVGKALRIRIGLGTAPAGAKCCLPTAASAMTSSRLDALAVDLKHNRPKPLRTHWTADSLRWRFCECPVADYRVLLNGDTLAAIIRLNKRAGLREGVVSLTNPAVATWARCLRAIKPAPVDYWVYRPGAVPGASLAALRHGFVEVPVSVMQLVHRPVVMSADEERIASSHLSWDLQFSDLELL